MKFAGLIAASLLAAASVRAVTLADVHGALAKLPGTGDLRAEYRVATESKEGGAAESAKGSVSVNVAQSGGNIGLSYSSDLLQTVARERLAHEADPEKSTPVSDTLRHINAGNVADSLSAADILERLLLHAKVRQETAGSFNGSPARLLVLDLEPALSKSEKKHIKKFESTLRLWVTQSGLPLFAESTTKVTAGFLMINFNQTSVRKTTFVQSGDHLIQARDEEETSGSGFGESSTDKRIVTVTLK